MILRALLISPLPGPFLGGQPTASEGYGAVRRSFVDIVGRSEPLSILLVDSGKQRDVSPSRVLRISRELHSQLLARTPRGYGQDQPAAALEQLLNKAGVCDALCTWREHGALRQAAEKLGVRYVSLSPAAFGSAVIDWIRIQATEKLSLPWAVGAEDTGTLPEFAHSGPLEAAYYGQFRPLPAAFGSAIYDARRPVVTLLIAAPPMAEGAPGALLNDSLESIDLTLSGLMEDGATAVLVPMGSAAQPLTQRVTQSFQRRRWPARQVSLRTLGLGFAGALLRKSAVVVSLHNAGAVDGILLGGVPGIFLGDECEAFRKLNPDRPLPMSLDGLRELGAGQQSLLTGICHPYIAEGIWVENRRPSPARFMEWLLRNPAPNSRVEAALPDGVGAAPPDAAPLLYTPHGTSRWAGPLPAADRVGRMTRKIRKLRRDPGRFFRDSKLPWLRAVGKLIADQDDGPAVPDHLRRALLQQPHQRRDDD